MGEYLKSIGNVIVIAVTLVGLLALFKIEDIYLSLTILFLILFIGFISLISYQIINLEKQIKEILDKYKRAEELINIKSDIKLLKNICKIK